MKVRRGCGRRRPRIEILPLIDIVFLLLVFFIYAMLSMAVHRGLPVTLPRSAAAGVEREALLAITIAKDGMVHVDREEVKLAALRDYLQQKSVPGRGVQLFADQGVSYQLLLDVLDAVAAAGLERISLQAAPRPDSPEAPE